jgi:hypothetical protein
VEIEPRDSNPCAVAVLEYCGRQSPPAHRAHRTRSDGLERAFDYRGIAGAQILDTIATAQIFVTMRQMEDRVEKRGQAASA